MYDGNINYFIYNVEYNPVHMVMYMTESTCIRQASTAPTSGKEQNVQYREKNCGAERPQSSPKRSQPNPGKLKVPGKFIS